MEGESEEEEEQKDQWGQSAASGDDDEAPRIWVSGIVERPASGGHAWYDDSRWGGGRHGDGSRWNGRSSPPEGRRGSGALAGTLEGTSDREQSWKGGGAWHAALSDGDAGAQYSKEQWRYKYTVRDPYARTSCEKESFGGGDRSDLAEASPLGMAIPTPQRRWLGLGHDVGGRAPASLPQDLDEPPAAGEGEAELAASVSALSILAESGGRSHEDVEDVLEPLTEQLRRCGPSPAQLLAILRSLASLGCFHRASLDAAAASVASVAASFAPQELSECAQMLAELGLHNDAAMEAVLAEAVRRHAELGLDGASHLAGVAADPGLRRGLMLRSLLERSSELFGEGAGPPLAAAVAGQEARQEDSVRRRAVRGLAARAGSLAPRALAAALWTLAVLGVRESQAVVALAGAAAGRLGHLPPEDVGSLSWALGTLGFRHVPLMEALAREVSARSWDFTCAHLVQVAFGFAALGLRHASLLEKLSWELSWKAGELAPSDVVHLAWAFATLACPDQELMRALALRALAVIERFDAEHLASLSWAFASLHLRHGRLMQAVAREAAQKIEDFEEEDLSRLAWAFATLDLAPVELTRLLVQEAGKRSSRSSSPQPRTRGRAGMESGGREAASDRWQWSEPPSGQRSEPPRSRSSSGEATDESDAARRRSGRQWASSGCRGGCDWSDRISGKGRGRGRGGRAGGGAPSREASRDVASEATHQAAHGPDRMPRNTCEEFPRVEVAVAAATGSAPDANQAKRSVAEFKKLPPPRRVPQRKRKQQALEALRGEAALPQGEADVASAAPAASSGAAASVAEAPARRAEREDGEQDEDDDFDGSAQGGGYDLLGEALADSGDEPSFDALLAGLRQQLRMTHGETLVGRLTDTQVLSRASVADLDGAGRGDVSREDQDRIMKLLEARRLADKAAAGGHRRRKHRDKSERKLARDYIKTEIMNAYNAQVNQHVRYYNSVAIRVHKGEKAVDTKTIDAVTARQQEGVPQELNKLSKEDRCMARRCA